MELKTAVLGWVDTWMPEFEQSGKSWKEFRSMHFDTQAIPKSGCMYVFKRGNKIGLECGTAVRDGSPFCSKHKTVQAVDSTVFQLDLKKIAPESEGEPYSSSEDDDTPDDTVVEEDYISNEEEEVDDE